MSSGRLSPSALTCSPDTSQDTSWGSGEQDLVHGGRVSRFSSWGSGEQDLVRGARVSRI